MYVFGRTIQVSLCLIPDQDVGFRRSVVGAGLTGVPIPDRKKRVDDQIEAAADVLVVHLPPTVSLVLKRKQVETTLEERDLRDSITALLLSRAEMAGGARQLVVAILGQYWSNYW